MSQSEDEGAAALPEDREPLPEGEYADARDQGEAPALAVGPIAPWIQRLDRDELLAECRRRKLRAGGKKEALQQRIQRHENARERVSMRQERVAALDDDRDDTPRGIGMPIRARGMAAEARRDNARRDGARRDDDARTEDDLSAGDDGTESERGVRPPPEPRMRRRERPRRYDDLTPPDVYDIMKMWGLSYAGEGGAKARDFIDKVNRARRYMPLPEVDVLGCIAFFLQGSALKWYDQARGTCHTWAEFERAFLDRFGQGAMRRLVREEARNRRQGPKERAATYIDCVQNLYARVDPPWSVDEQLDLAHMGLWPELQRAVPMGQFGSFEELLRLVQAHEESILVAKKYRPPETGDMLVYPEFGYKPPPRRERAVAYATDALGDDSQVGAQARENRGERGKERDDDEDAKRSRRGERTRRERESRSREAARRRRDKSSSETTASSEDASESEPAKKDRRHRRSSRTHAGARRKGASRGRSTSRRYRTPRVHYRSTSSEDDSPCARSKRNRSVGKRKTRPQAKYTARPGPSRPPRREASTPRDRVGPCYVCGKTGHFARECPEAKHKPGRANGNLAGNARRGR